MCETGVRSVAILATLPAALGQLVGRLVTPDG